MSGATFWALMLSSALVGWAALMRAVAGTWLQPAAFFPLFWCFAGILPLIFIPQDPVGANAILWLLAASVAITCGAAAGNGGLRTKRIARTAAPTEREISVFAGVTLGAIVLGIGSNVAFLSGSGIALREILDPARLVIVANEFYFARYGENPPPPPVLSRALLPFVYLAPATGGILFVLARRKRVKLLALLAFFPAFAVTLIQTTKAALLFALILWFSGYFATRLRLGQLAVFTARHLLVASGATLTLAAVFIASGIARLASTDLSLTGYVIEKLATSAFGHMTVFSQWLTDFTARPWEPSLGRLTFAGPLELLGVSQRLPGLYETLVRLVGGDTSNIYTGFRPLIQDFSIPGALAILGLLGFIGGAGFRLVVAGRWSAVPLLIAAYVTILWTPITWFWIYNSLTATVIAIALLVWLVRLWRGATRTVTT